MPIHEVIFTDRVEFNDVQTFQILGKIRRGLHFFLAHTVANENDFAEFGFGKCGAVDLLFKLRKKRDVVFIFGSLDEAAQFAQKLGFIVRKDKGFGIGEAEREEEAQRDRRTFGKVCEHCF